MLYTDQLFRPIEVKNKPQRIISTVPSQTELLVDLGLEEYLVGITKFCIHPAHLKKNKNIIGGTKNLNLEKIRSLNPDLIIANKEENTQSEIEALAQEFPVYISDIFNLQDAVQMIMQIGEICQASLEAKNLIQIIKREFGNWNLVKKKKVFSAAYFIWREPYMLATKNTFIDNMLLKAGFVNAFSNFERYPIISAADLKAANPDVILLSSEPYPFKEKHRAEFQNICPNAHIQIVDGEMFSWYGSRLQYTAQYFQQLQHLLFNLE